MMGGGYNEKGRGSLKASSGGRMSSGPVAAALECAKMICWALRCECQCPAPDKARQVFDSSPLTRLNGTLLDVNIIWSFAWWILVIVLDEVLVLEFGSSDEQEE